MPGGPGEPGGEPPAPGQGDARGGGDDGGAPPGAAGTPPRPPLNESGLLGWLLAIALLGIGGVALGEQELAGLIALAGLFVAAQAADLDPRWKPLYWSVGWIVPLGGAAAFGGLAVMLQEAAPAGAARVALTAVAVAGGATCLLLAHPRLIGPLTARLLGGDGSGHADRTAVRLVVAGLMLGVPAWFALREPLEEMLTGPDSLLTGQSFLGGLFGSIALAFAAAGYGLRRGGREAFERLGLRPVTAADALWIVVGVAALWALNASAEVAQRTWLPELYEQDRRFGELLAGQLAPWQMALLALNAGVGEELTLRGALQPRLGIVLTSVLFAALHVQYSWFGMLVILALGITLGVLRARTSTTVVIAVHTVYDLAALLTI
jgi:hypothetical protein